jgi:hypothetical protein
MVGRQLGIDVVMREYEGKEYPNVKKTMTVEAFKGTPSVDVMTPSRPAEISKAVDDMDMSVITADDL